MSKKTVTTSKSQTSVPVKPEMPRMQSTPPPQHTDLYHDPAHVLPGESQRFIRNNRYFTICIYAFTMIIISGILLKMIIDFETTKAWFANIFTILGPFIFGALVAYILNPMVRMFFRHLGILGKKTWEKKTKFRLTHMAQTILAIMLTYVLVISFIVVTLRYVIPEITSNIIDFANYIPQTYDSMLAFIDDLQTQFPDIDITSLTKPLTDAIPGVVSTLRDMATSVVPAIYSLSMSIASGILNVLITIIVSAYMLYDKNRLMKTSWRIIYAFLPKKYIPTCHEILTECNRLFSSFVVGKFIDSAIIGILCFIVMALLRLDYFPLISIIVGITNMIPYFGPFIGAIPGILILLFVSPVKALIFSIMILALQQFDGLILGPKILGDSTGMKPLWIIFAITIGGNIAGVVGMFLGVPAVAIISYLFDRYLVYRLAKKGITESMIEKATKIKQLP